MNKILLSLLIVSSLGCKSSKETKSAVETVEQQNIVQAETFVAEGRWGWVSSSFLTRGMKEPKVSTPETREYSIVLEFEADLISIEKNGEQVAKVPFTLEEHGDGIQIIRVEIPQDDFPFHIASGPVYLRGNELLISGGYNDAGENQTYKREN
jgi:hypothetical protein